MFVLIRYQAIIRITRNLYANTKWINMRSSIEWSIQMLPHRRVVIERDLKHMCTLRYKYVAGSEPQMYATTQRGRACDKKRRDLYTFWRTHTINTHINLGRNQAPRLTTTTTTHKIMRIVGFVLKSLKLG